MKIRISKPSDAKGVANVLVNSYNVKSIEEGIEVFKSETAKQQRYIVVEEKGKIIGLATWIMHGLPKHQLAELDRIAVLPDYRGHGIARPLFEALLKDCKEFYKKNKSRLRKMYILTHYDNVRAHRFYQKLGFAHETTLKQHYYANKDEFVYSRFFA
jgi:ribosomal protein S18 acetylase RimI-like enzyme